MLSLNSVGLDEYNKRVAKEESDLERGDEVDAGLVTEKDNEEEPKADNNRNRFQIRRNMTMGMYDVALLMANVSQLKAVLDSEQTKNFSLVITLLGVSISLHVISAVLLYILFVMEKIDEHLKIPKGEEIVKEKQAQTTKCIFCSRNQSVCYCWHMYRIDCTATFFVFVVTVVNVFITAFISSE